MSIDAYDLLDTIATALVFIGVVGESLPELLHIPKSKVLENFVKRISLALLIVGLSGELWAGWRASQLTKVEIAKLEVNANSASAKAADANAQAVRAAAEEEILKNQNLKLQRQLESERTQRLKLARDVAPRYFLYQSVWPKLKPFAGTKFIISFIKDVEAERLAKLIDETLITAKWARAGPLWIEQNVNAYDEGVIVSFPTQWPVKRAPTPDLTYKAAVNFCRILSANNIGSLLAASSDLPPNTIRIQVHSEPDPGSTDAMIRNLRREFQLASHKD